MRYLLITILLACSAPQLFAQRIDTLMHAYTSSYPREKAYLQMDKSQYNTGETIWYKAYLTVLGYPSPLSKNLYVEILDDKGHILDRNSAPVIESSAAGSFKIPDGYKSPYVYVRAYSRWMLNFDTAFLFFKPLRVLNNSIAQGKAEAVSKTVLRFFPEGGDCVEGLESRVAFKAADRDGYPVNVQGTIVNAKGDKVASFVSVRDGMGTFAFTPEKGGVYVAKWKDKSNVLRTTPMPVARPMGVVLRIDSQDSSKVYTISGNNGDSVPVATYHLVCHTSGDVFYMATLRLRNGETISQSFATVNLPSGIVTVTLFDDQWQPVAERISFVDNNEYMFFPAIHQLATKLERRGENAIEIEYADTVKSNMSVSITDADLDGPVNSKADNIISNLLLTSELRGRIYNPWDYLSNPIDSVRRELDLVMLTNGWRRYNWSDIVGKNYPPLRFLPDSFMAIKGRVYGVSDKRAIGDINIMSDGGGGHNRFMFAEVDTSGRFQIPNYFIYGQQKIYYQFNKKDQFPGATVSLDNGLFKGTGKINVTDSSLADVQVPDEQLLAKNKAYLHMIRDSTGSNLNKIKQLQTIVIKAPEKSPEEKLEDKYTSGLFKGGDGYQFDVENDPFGASSMSVFTYLQGKVAGLQINANGPQTSLSWRGGSPGLYLDEMNVDVSALQNMSMSDVAFIKVFRPPFIGMGGANGGIAIYTKKGGPSKPTGNTQSMESGMVIGYTPPKEFYSPDYAVPIPAHDTSDLRSTLFWQPFILLDKTTRRARVSFYNNDITKRFKIVLEGMTADGRWAHKEMLIDNPGPGGN